MSGPVPAPPVYLDLLCTGGSFRVGFCEGVDRAVIADTEGWVAQEVRLAEGTCEAIRDEAHRLLDVAVQTGRYPGRCPRAGAGERKRTITQWCASAKTTHHPRWGAGRRHNARSGDPGGRRPLT